MNRFSGYVIQKLKNGFPYYVTWVAEDNFEWTNALLVASQFETPEEAIAFIKFHDLKDTEIIHIVLEYAIQEYRVVIRSEIILPKEE